MEEKKLKNLKKSGRPPFPDWIHALVVDYSIGRYREMPEKSLAILLRKEIKQNADIKTIPTLSTLEKWISKARNHPVSDLDSLWSVGYLSEREISPEALPVILRIYEKRSITEDKLTRREALWIGRLFKVVEDPDILERFAVEYACREKIDWILGKAIYTRGFDVFLLWYNDPARRQKVLALLEQLPLRFNSIPARTAEEKEILEKQLQAKGYSLYRDIEKEVSHERPDN
jgi:hypothetical protein